VWRATRAASEPRIVTLLYFILHSRRKLSSRSISARHVYLSMQNTAIDIIACETTLLEMSENLGDGGDK
jgi:hypothetical protein